MPPNQIRVTYDAGAMILRRDGCEIEPWEVALAVEQHRWAWRPPVVRVVLVAESHVFTSAADVTIKVKQFPVADAPRTAPLRLTPPEFVRLIYCLGYGELTLLSSSPAAGNAGTRQSWDIFGELAGTGKHSGAITTAQRIEWKLRTLRKLAARGIWLLDASVHGIYRPDGQLVPVDARALLHRSWWEHYGKSLLASLLAANPDLYVCVVGKMVWNALTDVGAPPYNWIYQPQARNQHIDKRRGRPELLGAVAER